jgi:capsular polysaccharide biosynthesis protein
MGHLEDDALRLKHIATVNNTNVLVVLTVFASCVAYFAVFFICDTYDKRAVIILYRKCGNYEMEL